MQSWDSLYIYFISGTGNTRLCSQWIAEEAARRGIKTVTQQIDRLENIQMPHAGETPLIGFAFPTHGFNAAPIMLKFIAGFPAKLCSNIFLINTRGCLKLHKIFIPGLSGLALVLPAFLLWLKGYKCTGFRQIDMPSNWIPLHPGLRNKVVESIILKAEPIVRRFANRILDGRNVFRGLYSLPVDLLISPVALGYYIGGRFFLSKTFIANNNCNNCGICIRECPTSSIRIVNGRPYWKLTCESCMRCLNHCPLRAIEATHGMAVVFMLAMSAVNSWLALFLISRLSINAEALWWAITYQFISIAVMITVTTFLYLVVHYLMAFKPLKYLVRFTSLTAFPFWRRYIYFKEKKKN